MPAARNEDRKSEALRIRRCNDPTCNAMFTICERCDRGQRYCSAACRTRMRRQQRVAATRRYQASPAGKQAHIKRQRAYRERVKSASVTHHGPDSIISLPTKPVPELCRCLICGFETAWINPFPRLPLHLRRRRRYRPPWRRREVQISTFSDDR
jgi:hypothetical protein